MNSVIKCQNTWGICALYEWKGGGVKFLFSKIKPQTGNQLMKWASNLKKDNAILSSPDFNGLPLIQKRRLLNQINLDCKSKGVSHLNVKCFWKLEWQVCGPLWCWNWSIYIDVKSYCLVKILSFRLSGVRASKEHTVSKYLMTEGH